MWCLFGLRPEKEEGDPGILAAEAAAAAADAASTLGEGAEGWDGGGGTAEAGADNEADKDVPATDKEGELE